MACNDSFSLGPVSIINFLILWFFCVPSCGHTWLTISRKNINSMVGKNVMSLSDLHSLMLSPSYLVAEGEVREIQVIKGVWCMGVSLLLRCKGPCGKHLIVVSSFWKQPSANSQSNNGTSVYHPKKINSSKNLMEYIGRHFLNLASR